MRAGARVWLMDIVTTNDGKIIQIPKPEAEWEAEAWLFPRSQHHIRLGFKKAKKTKYSWKMMKIFRQKNGKRRQMWWCHVLSWRPLVLRPSWHGTLHMASCLPVSTSLLSFFLSHFIAPFHFPIDIFTLSALLFFFLLKIHFM